MEARGVRRTPERLGTPHEEFVCQALYVVMVLGSLATIVFGTH